ncbi:transposase [Streptomyces rhizosphaericola]|uniref:Transposase n=1 Tax=Streptomyces rhizosphaericola TaxID=2564098 RepID=A0ABY2PGR5_9ACTN|nr:transposase [Streptomyces rhizosphaericola]
MELLLPCRERRSRHPGRKPLPDRQALCGILFVSHTRIQWEYLPEELGFASGMARRRRLRDGNGTGVRQQQLIVSAAVNRNRGAGEDHQALQAGSRQPRLPPTRGHGQPSPEHLVSTAREEASSPPRPASATAAPEAGAAETTPRPAAPTRATTDAATDLRDGTPRVSHTSSAEKRRRRVPGRPRTVRAPGQLSIYRPFEAEPPTIPPDRWAGGGTSSRGRAGRSVSSAGDSSAPSRSSRT